MRQRDGFGFAVPCFCPFYLHKRGMSGYGLIGKWYPVSESHPFVNGERFVQCPDISPTQVKPQKAHRSKSEPRRILQTNSERTAKKSPEAVTEPWKKQSLKPERSPRKSKKQSRSEQPRFLMKYSCQEYFTMEWLNCQLLIWQTKNLPCWFRTAVLTYTRYGGRKQKGFCLCW